jgi:hypothetical protein
MAGRAVEATQKALYNYGPGLLTKAYWDKAANKGKGSWLPRLQAAAGPHKDKTTDPHAAGRALDIVLFANDPTEKDFADRIVQVFLNLKAGMRFISVIYNEKEWNGAGVQFPRGGDAMNRHVTHIHIEWGKTGVGIDSFGSDLEDALYNEFSAGNISSGDYAVV